MHVKWQMSQSGHKISNQIPTATHFHVSANLNLFRQVFTAPLYAAVLIYMMRAVECEEKEYRTEPN